MDLHRTINAARRFNATIDEIYLLLALIEGDAIDTVYFKGAENEDLVDLLLDYIKEKEASFTQEHSVVEFVDYLSQQKELNFSPKALLKIIVELLIQGEDKYEFKKFNRMV